MPTRSRQLLVHIGTHKTGTSAIQESLNAASAELRQEGIEYLGTTKHLRRVMKEDGPDKESIARARSYVQERLASTKAPLSLMSYEALSGSLGAGYADAIEKARLLAELVHPSTVQILVYLRRQDDFVQSAYVQHVHEGASFSFSEYLRELPGGAFDWLALLEAYATVFGKDSLRVRTYDRQRLASAGGLLQDFAGAIGSQCLPSFSVDRNRSYDHDAVEIARLCNPLLENREDILRMRLILQKVSAKLPLQPHQYFESDQQLHTFLDQYESSNRVVARDWLETPQEQLFPAADSTSEGMSSQQALSLERAIQVLMLAIVELDKQANSGEESAGRSRRSPIGKLRSLPLLRRIGKGASTD